MGFVSVIVFLVSGAITTYAVRAIANIIYGLLVLAGMVIAFRLGSEWPAVYALVASVLVGVVIVIVTLPLYPFVSGMNNPLKEERDEIFKVFDARREKRLLEHEMAEMKREDRTRLKLELLELKLGIPLEETTSKMTYDELSLAVEGEKRKAIARRGPKPVSEDYVGFSYDVRLVEVGNDEAAVLRILAKLPNVDRERAKELVDGIPSIILRDVSPEVARKVEWILAVKGATVEMRPAGRAKELK